MVSGQESTSKSRVEEGRALFNARRFFEAHEVWEKVWRAERGQARLGLQGLIQIAAGFHKGGKGAAGPCARLLEAGLEKLSAAGLAAALPDFSEAVRANLAQARRWERGEAAGPGDFPSLPPLGGVE
jgi:hypothetical protein